jgi:hypothetical protein
VITVLPTFTVTALAGLSNGGNEPANARGPKNIPQISDNTTNIVLISFLFILISLSFFLLLCEATYDQIVYRLRRTSRFRVACIVSSLHANSLFDLRYRRWIVSVKPNALGPVRLNRFVVRARNRP